MDVFARDKVYVIILNWNGWKDTIECLESVFRSTYAHFQVVLCDNASSDQSIEKFIQWAEKVKINTLKANVNKDSSSLLLTDQNKMIKCTQYTNENIIRREICDDNESLVVICNSENKGFSGGNNIGIQYALLKNDFAYIWLLNNDTIVCEDSLEKLISAMEPSVGIVGSTLCYCDKIDTVQGVGGHLNPYLCTTKAVGCGENLDMLPEDLCIDSVVGASFLFKKQLIESIGTLDSNYFLYYEEIDFAKRAGYKNWGIKYVKSSVVYHKEGCSTQNSYRNEKKALITEYHLARSRVIFAKKHYKKFLVLVIMSNLVPVFRRIIRGHFINAKEVIRGVINGLLARR